MMRVVRLGVALMAVMASAGFAAPSGRDAVRVGDVLIDRLEVTVGAFRAFAGRANLVTAAEREDGGFEYAGGWQKRRGWTYARPYGEQAAAESEPAVHLTWEEAGAFCREAGGRLPSAAEWRRAAYTEERAGPPQPFARGRTYAYPSGERPVGMWIRSAGATEHRPVGAGPAGVNGLHDMGGNVWEWLADRRGREALTAGGSWWYDAPQTRADAMQWKDASFYAVYVGFRCAYDP